LLNSLIGQSFNQKSKFEAYKILKQIHKQADEYSMVKGLCYIVQNGEIKGVGGSSLMKDKKTGEIVSDLILDNFGLWLTGICRSNVGTTKVVVLKNRSAVDKNVNVYSTETQSFFSRTNSGAKGFLVQVGSGTTAPARTDTNIETAFGTSPESINFTSTTDAVYNLTNSNFKFLGSITAGGSGTINESIMLSFWEQVVGGSPDSFVMFRDIISPGQSFVPGQSIALEYTVQL